jgi:hypothetical protein
MDISRDAVLVLLYLSIGLLVFMLSVATWRMYNSPEGTAESWGGLHGWVLPFFYISYLMGGVGQCFSFYLYFTYREKTVEFLPILCCVVVNCSLAVYLIALLRTQVLLIFGTMIINLVAYSLFFMLTLRSFPVTAIAKDPFLWITHVGNAVCILHAIFFDLYLWQYGYWIALARRDNRCTNSC